MWKLGKTLEADYLGRIPERKTHVRSTNHIRKLIIIVFIRELQWIINTILWYQCVYRRKRPRDYIVSLY